MGIPGYQKHIISMTRAFVSCAQVARTRHIYYSGFAQVARTALGRHQIARPMTSSHKVLNRSFQRCFNVKTTLFQRCQRGDILICSTSYFCILRGSNAVDIHIFI